jgi:hypothetical protein
MGNYHGFIYLGGYTKNMKAMSGIFDNYLGAYPTASAKSATGAGTGDGSEFRKQFLDELLGMWQAITKEAGYSDFDGTTEAYGTSQIVESLRRLCGSPGEIVASFHNPTALALQRLILLTGQTITITTYPALVNNVYVGDANNATAAAFYKCTNAGDPNGSRNVAGTLLKLPDMRGYTLRGLNTSAGVDPDGASRSLGSVQLDSFQGHFHQAYIASGSGSTTYFSNGTTASSLGAAIGLEQIKEAKTDGTNGTPRTAIETRMVNVACNYAIRT